MSAMFYELSLVAIVGSQNNKTFHNRKLVLWDNIRKTVVNSTQFKSAITSLKIIKKLIFVGTKEEINICVYNESHNYIETIQKIQIDSHSCSNFEVWVNESNYYIINVLNKSQLRVNMIYCSCLEIDTLLLVETGFQNGIQNIFYCDKIKSLFVVDSDGINIKCYHVNFDSTGKIDLIARYELYRGKSTSIISSITSIQDRYLALSSCNGTIHIFDSIMEENTQINRSYSYISYFYNFFTNPFKLNKSILKIRLDQIKNNEIDFFDYDFKTKGIILLSNEQSNDINDNKKTDELVCLSYDGKIYTIKLDLKLQNYEIKSTLDWSGIEDIKTSSNYISEDFTLDLISINKSKNDNNSDNWKII